VSERELHPRFKGYVCIVDGCSRVEYKHELCKRHWDEVPDVLVDEMMIASVRAAMDASRAYDPQIRELAKGMAEPARSPDDARLNVPLARVLLERAQDGYVNPTGGKTTGRERKDA
jgi:hypothetical protein